MLIYWSRFSIVNALIPNPNFTLKYKSQMSYSQLSRYEYQRYYLFQLNLINLWNVSGDFL